MKIYLCAAFIGLAGCLSPKRETNIDKNQDKLPATNSELFTPVGPGIETSSLTLPPGFRFTVLFSQYDSVMTADGFLAPAKGNHDFTGFIPIASSLSHGYLYISHETRIADAELGDGGGATILEVIDKNGSWEVIGVKRNVDFRPVGGTVNNCGGTVTPAGLVLTAEEMEPASNAELSNNGKSFSDTHDFNGMPKHQNMGWMVLVDPVNAVALEKVYNFGRFVHEDAHCMPDGKTVYLTDDNCPSVFFKFEAKQPNNYNEGQLFAYRQSEDGSNGLWLKLPMHMDSLKSIRNVAIRMGATMFVRQEWVDYANGKLYISETGEENFDYGKYVRMGGTVPDYLRREHSKGADKYADQDGRILEFDPKTNRMRPLVEGGPMADGGYFSNPDALSVVLINGRQYLVISEDLPGLSGGRVSENALKSGKYYNELYFLDLGIANPGINDLKRFAAAPKGSETTGSCFSPDGKTLFINIQHPDESNPAPFNRSCTLAISGF